MCVCVVRGLCGGERERKRDTNRELTKTKSEIRFVSFLFLLNSSKPLKQISKLGKKALYNAQFVLCCCFSSFSLEFLT